jgi:hypothetical protein
MSILDRTKAAAERTKGQISRGTAQGRARLTEVQAQRKHAKLIQQLGEA